MVNNTIEEVIATESKAQEVVADYEEKKKQLSIDKQEKIEALQQASKGRLESFEQERREEAQKTYDVFKAERDFDQEKQLAVLHQQFSSKESELVGYVVGEVKKLYGNR